MTATINVYYLPQVVNLTLAPTSGATLMNYSATRSDFKVMKGITTEIHFFIKNTDRVPVKYEDGETLSIVITDHARKHTVGTFDLELFNPERSIWKLTLPKEAVDSWPLATLMYSVIVNRNDDKVMLYLDRSYGGYSTLDVISGPYPDQPETEVYEVSAFTPVNDGGVSSAIKASLHPHFPQSSFSATATTNEFVGTVRIMATLDIQPAEESDAQWFVADERSFDTAHTGIIDFHFEGSYEWIRFHVQAERGTVEKFNLRR